MESEAALEEVGATEATVAVASPSAAGVGWFKFIFIVRTDAVSSALDGTHLLTFL
jgi:hypothetical protein